MTQGAGLSNADARAALAVDARSGKEPPGPSRSSAPGAPPEPPVAQADRGGCSAACLHKPPPQPTTTTPSSAQPAASTNPSKWFSLEGLRELTRGAIFKSGPPTPTRALSAAHSSQSDGRDTPGRTSNDGTDHSGAQTPRTTASAGAQVPPTRGKLTIKIVEARGLRKCRDPYVVAVFQRSELISGGPRAVEEEEHNLNAPSAIGGIPIQRQGSDSGRSMAIPMRSRQSSNTSITDYNTFRSRTARAPSSNPKWDAEAVL